MCFKLNGIVCRLDGFRGCAVASRRVTHMPRLDTLYTYTEISGNHTSTLKSPPQHILVVHVYVYYIIIYIILLLCSYHVVSVW